MGRAELVGMVCEREMEDGAGDGVGESEGVLGKPWLAVEEYGVIDVVSRSLETVHVEYDVT
jgi:hypothetical protein